MIGQASPGTNVKIYVADVVAERAGGANDALFRGFLSDWQNLCVTYMSNLGSPTALRPYGNMTDKLKIALHNLYSGSKSNHVHAKIISKLRDHSLKICPACGDLHPPSTLDHYLPKEIYPEYSIFPENLSPMCDICQGKKGTKTVDTSGLQMFMHPYFDVSRIGSSILKLSISPPFNAPSQASLGVASGVPIHLKPLVERHLKYLDLQDRFNKYFSISYIRLLKLVVQIRGCNLNLRDQLNLFRFNASQTSLNSWDYLLYDECLSNQALLNYLSCDKLPDNL